MKRIAVVLLVVASLAGCRSSMDSSMDSSTNPSSQGNMTIAEVAMSTGMHGTLVAALKAAGLDGMLMNDGPYTVFAPTDEAFAKLPEGTVEMLLRPENREKLRAVLSYHVVPGNVSAKQVMGMTSAKTANGAMLRIGMMGDGVMINDSNVVKADVKASNGTVHVIDSVLMPPM